MKRGAVIFLVLLFVAGNLAGQDAGVSFTWAFVKQGTGGSPVPLSFSEKVSVDKGDLFKIFVQPDPGTYVYLILQDAQGDVALLFPGSFSDFASPAYAKARTLIPAGDDWFTLDAAKGTERFHLLASTTRLKDLETRVAALEKAAANTQSSDSTLGAARQAVLDEIARARKAHSQISMGAEKPVTIAGGTRGIGQEMEKKAVRINGKEFYTKTFRLEH
jgi:hypothetical protein